MSGLVQEKQKAPVVANGDFVWYELITSDLDAAETFYRRVVRLGRT